MSIAAGLLIGGKYRLGKSIGKGSFGDVYASKNVLSGERVAIKFEKTSNIYRQLYHEYKVYRRLSNIPGIGSAHYFGKIPNYDFMVMDLLGPSLENVFNYCGRKFSLPTTLQLGTQMVRIIEQIHYKKFIHRDIKPDNFVLQTSNSNHEIFLIDFGLAKRYVNTDNLHIPHEDNRSFTGTARYASINSLMRYTQSRRDDIESVGYILVYFLKGSLPWQNIRGTYDRKQRKEIILEMKMSTPLSKLCDSLPNEIHLFLKYCRERKFDERPNYAYLRKLLRPPPLENQLEPPFDWNLRPRARNAATTV